MLGTQCNSSLVDLTGEEKTNQSRQGQRIWSVGRAQHGFCFEEVDEKFRVIPRSGSLPMYLVRALGGWYISTEVTGLS